MPENGSFRNCCEAGAAGGQPSGNPRPPWVAPALFSVLAFTTVVDVLGNLLVILSVLRNRKLRNYAGERHARVWDQATSPSAAAPSLLLGAEGPQFFSL